MNEGHEMPLVIFPFKNKWESKKALRAKGTLLIVFEAEIGRPLESCDILANAATMTTTPLNHY